MQGTHVLDPEAVKNFYYEAYKQIREITGIGEGKGPMIVSQVVNDARGILDGFPLLLTRNFFRASMMAS
jgi:hypothetical protein